ncbi:hypothetical protein H2203_006364 [Taxawa tesnikishii (nom. ined.)]|nr:hypothetical protein H2203_006364 [Dothideales sp. JES 119]
MSNSGKPFFVLWSLLAVPTLTILISNMGDTVVKSFSDFTIWIGSLTVLPGEHGFSATAKHALKQVSSGKLNPNEFETQKPPGFLSTSAAHGSGPNDDGPKDTMMDRIADRIANHLEDEEMEEAQAAEMQGDELERDIHFYHYVLAREVRQLMKDLSASPPKQYEWGEWEYYLKLIGDNDYEPTGNEQDKQRLIPDELRLPEDNKQQKQKKGQLWSWLSDKSPLMGTKTETEWILERLTASLERELRNARKAKEGEEEKKRPPISMSEMKRGGRLKSGQSGSSGGGSGSEGDGKEARNEETG